MCVGRNPPAESTHSNKTIPGIKNNIGGKLAARSVNVVWRETEIDR